MSRRAKYGTFAAAALAVRFAQLHIQDRRREARGEPNWSHLMREIRAERRAGTLPPMRWTLW